MGLIYKNSERDVDNPSDETDRHGSPDVSKIQRFLHSDHKRNQHPNRSYEEDDIRRKGHDPKDPQ
jgi:hypothetical protein